MKEPLILHLETAGERCSVALSRGTDMLALQEAEEAFSHIKIITFFIEDCLKKAGVPLQALDAVAVSSGPGSYTSLRVGFSTAKGICYALGKPLVVVDTLLTLALAARQQHFDPTALYCPMIDARRLEVYTALFDAKGNRLTEPAPMVLETTSFQDFFKVEKKIIFCGSGAPKWGEMLRSEHAFFSPIVANSAAYMLLSSLAAFAENRFSDLAYALPYYLKPPNITVSKASGTGKG